MRPGLFDRRLLGIAGRGERGRFRLDRGLGARVLGGEAIDLLAQLGQPVRWLSRTAAVDGAPARMV
ncbi:MAG: hypothetical protein ACXWIG_18290 [Caldimonas sp.]